jgi:hypothetical protein
MRPVPGVSASGTADKMSKWSVTPVTGEGYRLWNAFVSPPAYTWLLCMKTSVVGVLPSLLTHTGTSVPAVTSMVQTADSLGAWHTRETAH